MAEREILATPVGIMNDMVACYQIHKGIAKSAGTLTADRQEDDERMLPNLL